MILLPYGHDQSVYGTPWATYGIIALNAAVFAATLALGVGAEARLDRSVDALERAAAAHPRARLGDELIERAPPSARPALGALRQTDPLARLTRGDVALEEAAAEVIAASEALPAQRFGYVPARPAWWSPVTSLFMHGGILHLLGNMVFLWLAGAVIECFWDRGPYLALYLLAGLGGVLAHHLADPTDGVPVIGASGAVAGMLGAFAVGYPKTRVRVFWLMFPFGAGHFYVPAAALLGLWAAAQLVSALAFDDGVAYWAHVGGFAVGAAAALVMNRMGWVIEDAGDGSGPGR